MFPKSLDGGTLEVMENLIEKILELTKLRGFTQGGLERAAGLSANRISKWKGGTGEPSVSEAARIAKLLDVSLDQLVHGEMRTLTVHELTPEEEVILGLIRRMGIDQAWDRLVGIETASPQQDAGGSPQNRRIIGSASLPPLKANADGNNESPPVPGSPVARR